MRIYRNLCKLLLATVAGMCLLLFPNNSRLVADDAGPANVCEQPGVRLSGGMTHSSSISASADLFTGKRAVRMVEFLPQDLVITWPKPVTFNTCRIHWDSAKIYATHYGLEYWDDAVQTYKLVFEIENNAEAVSTHHFAPVTTTRVRFTAFEHPVSYNTLIINRFELYSEEGAQHAQ